MSNKTHIPETAWAIALCIALVSCAGIKSWERVETERARAQKPKPCPCDLCVKKESR